MANPNFSENENINDPSASHRKSDHIDLAFSSRVGADKIDDRFYYEPIMSNHPIGIENLGLNFLGKNLAAPLWISSMTGGTNKAVTINKNLATACGEFKLGMGLGSCRQLLASDEYLGDFQVRKYLGDQPLYANLGIAQLEKLIDDNQVTKVALLLDKLEADGLIIHVNPMQEWLQPEGDRFKYAPIDTIKRILETNDVKIIVKEVGQGMGPQSLKALLSLPLEAIDFAASGGTNFALLELLRSSEIQNENYQNLTKIGHNPMDMIKIVNELVKELGDNCLCRQIIISGGVSDFLDGYYYMQKLLLPSIYGQASGFLKHATGSYATLQEFSEKQLLGLSLAKAYLTVKG